jgi:uncharacterized membrane protein YeiH
MDALGCTLVGVITALGGGTVRDVLLGRVPVFWFTAPSFLFTAAGTAIATFIAYGKLEDMGILREDVLW